MQFQIRETFFEKHRIEIKIVLFGYSNYPFQPYFYTPWTMINLYSNRTEPLVPASVTRPALILCRPGFNIDGAARLFKVLGLSQAFWTYSTILV